MKRAIKCLGLLVVLIIIIPLSINYMVTNGIRGYKPFNTEFNNITWFQFWYNYIPAIIAFAGTIYAVLQANKQNQKLQDFEKKNFAFSIMPEIKINLHEANFKRLIISSNFQNHKEIKEKYFEDQDKEIKKLLEELIKDIDDIRILSCYIN